MTAAFHSDTWYRVERLVPRLQPQARIHRQRYRGTAWYVVHDPASGRLHRFTPSAYLVIGLMDGRRTVDEIWKLALDRLGDDAPSQDDLVGLLSQLFSADLLLSDLAPDVEDLLRRERKQRRSVWVRNLTNPMSVRIPLWDPDAFLARTLPMVRRLYGPAGAVLWVTLVLPALIFAGMHWAELTGNLSDRVLAADNLLLLVVVFPLVKAVHELSHGWAVKAGGGEVHEMGLMLLVLAPVPYVDASASTAFRSKLTRSAVGAAGMAAELVLAALAMYVWLSVEPGLIRSIAFNVMLVAGVSTVVFNANPLLRFDGYYILGDLIEMPNLGQRATSYWGWLVQRYAFGSRETEPPQASSGEKRWFLFYGAASWLYRMFVVFAIALFIAEKFFFLGVVLALWGITAGAIWPLAKNLKFVATAPVLQRRRGRAVGVTASVALLLIVLLGLVPVPLSTLSEGVVWVPEQAQIRAGGDGFVRRVLVQPGTGVQSGDPLIELDDPELWAGHAAQAARVERFEAQLSTERWLDRARAAATAEALDNERATLRRLEERIDHLIILAGVPGQLQLPRASDLEGRYLRKGEALGYVLDGALRRAMVVVTQEDIDLVRSQLERVQVRFADRLEAVHDARIVREAPGGHDRLPSRALALGGGGRHAVDPGDAEGTRTLARIFLFELELPEALVGLQLGTRVYVRFTHESEPLARQAWRRLRQLFLARFNV